VASACKRGRRPRACQFARRGNSWQATFVSDTQPCSRIAENAGLSDEGRRSAAASGPNGRCPPESTERDESFTEAIDEQAGAAIRGLHRRRQAVGASVSCHDALAQPQPHSGKSRNLRRSTAHEIVGISMTFTSETGPPSAAVVRRGARQVAVPSWNRALGFDARSCQ
jgi:hypothetical protein